MDLTTRVRLFSLREANALIPTLQDTFARARKLRDQLSEVQGELSNAGHPVQGQSIPVDTAAPRAVQALQKRGKQLVDELLVLLREISELGIEVKAADGLVDFRSKLRGRTVYLCWRYGEEGVSHFHELDTGYSARKPLPEDAEFQGDLLH